MSEALGFVLVGTAGAIAVALVEWRFWNRPLGWLAAGGLVAASVVGGLTVAQPATLGGEGWYNVFPWRDIVFFLLMCLGMVAQTLAAALNERKRLTLERRKSDPDAASVALSIDKWEMTLPVLVAVPTFFGLLTQIDELEVGPLTLTMAFQNGFMWRAVLQQSV